MRLIRILALVFVLGSLCVGLAAAHGNDVAVDDQVSSDGSLLVAHVTYLEDAYLVAREATGDGPGEPVGHRHLDVGGSGVGERDLVRFSLDDSYWQDHEGNASLWIVLHNDDGNDGFDPGEDPLLEQGDEPVGDRITVGRGAGNVSAVAFDQVTNETVTVQRAELAEPGYVVLHAETADGRVVGAAQLGPGVHENVTVAIDGYHYNGQDESFELSAVVHRDDGNGEFDGADRPVRVGNASVSSAFEVEKAVQTVDVTPTETDTQTPSPTGTATATATTQSIGATETPTATPTAEATTSTPTVTQDAAAGETETGTTTGDGPGFGPLVGAIALLFGSLLARRRS